MKIYQSKLLNNFTELTHTFTTKREGNVAFHVNDTLSLVLKNHENLANRLHYDKRTLVHMKQIHSSSVHKVNENDSFETPVTCDALITDKPNTPLMVMVADCSPILFYDSNKKVIAVAHAGRAGAFTNIVQNVIESFTKEFHSKVEDIVVSIGASIKVCCYEVGSEIYDEAKMLHLEYAIIKNENSYKLDISAILHTQLLDAGIVGENIEISPLCTCCNNDTLFSYRANAKDGRFCGIISL